MEKSIKVKEHCTLCKTDFFEADKFLVICRKTAFGQIYYNVVGRRANDKEYINVFESSSFEECWSKYQEFDKLLSEVKIKHVMRY